MFQRYENRRCSFVTYFESLQFIIAVGENPEDDIYDDNDVIS